MSALGDGMALVAVTWLTLQLAPGEHRTTWVAVAVAAYTLPSAAGALLLGRVLSGRGGAQLAGWDAILRASALGAIPAAYLLDALNVGVYVGLLALSSLLHSWGSAGRFTLIAELLPQRDHIPANAILTTMAELATIVGPPLAGVLIGWSGAVAVIAIDAASFAILAATYRLAIPRDGGQDPAADAVTSHASGFKVIWQNQILLSLVGLSFCFFLLFGPVYVALPILVTEVLHGSATLLGFYYTAFGIGAVLGGLAAGYLRQWPAWPTLISIVIGFGAAMLPLGLGAPTVVAVTSFAIAGLIWAPYMSISMALFQRSTTRTLLPQVLAANGAATVLSVPVGTLLGGPLVSALGPRATLLACAAATIAAGLITAIIAIVLNRGDAVSASDPRKD